MGKDRMNRDDYWCDEKIIELRDKPYSEIAWNRMKHKCDDNGVMRYTPIAFKAAIFPANNFNTEEIEDIIKPLIDLGLIVRYIINDNEYLAFNNKGWAIHQILNHPQPCTNPLPEGFLPYKEARKKYYNKSNMKNITDDKSNITDDNSNITDKKSNDSVILPNHYDVTKFNLNEFNLNESNNISKIERTKSKINDQLQSENNSEKQAHTNENQKYINEKSNINYVIDNLNNGQQINEDKKVFVDIYNQANIIKKQVETLTPKEEKNLYETANIIRSNKEQLIEFLKYIYLIGITDKTIHAGSLWARDGTSISIHSIRGNIDKMLERFKQFKNKNMKDKSKKQFDKKLSAWTKYRDDTWRKSGVLDFNDWQTKTDLKQLRQQFENIYQERLA